jgi:hypothetical protein
MKEQQVIKTVIRGIMRWNAKFARDVVNTLPQRAAIPCVVTA